MSGRISFFLTQMLLALILLPACAGADGAAEAYAPVAESSRFILYLKEDTLSVMIESKASGKRLYSAVRDMDRAGGTADWKGYFQSGVVMEYMENDKKGNVQADFVNTPHTILYERLPSGFEARVLYDELGISFRMTVSLDDTGLHVCVPQRDIVEETPQYTLQSLCVFPFLGNTRLGEEAGYMLIPDGQGALIYLEDNEGQYSSPYVKHVYGPKVGVDGVTQNKDLVDPESIVMPVFGMVHTEDRIGFLGVIEDGDCCAEIMAYPNGVRTDYNWIGAKFTYRLLYSQPTGPSSGAVKKQTEYPRQFDVKLHFFLVDEERADYTGLACAWRQFLAEQGVGTGMRENGCFSIRLEFLGMEKERMLIGTRDVAMTAYSQAEEILRQLKAAGVNGISASYRGWQTGGLTGGLPVSGFSPAACLGGGAGMRALMETASAEGIDFSLETDFLTLNTAEHLFYGRESLKMITSQTVEYATYGPVYEKLNALTPSDVLRLALSTAEEFQHSGVTGVSLAGFPALMTDYYAGGYCDSSRMKTAFEQAAERYSQSFDTFLGAANAYLWKYAAGLYDMPLSHSGFSYVDQGVPFLSIALSGLLPVYSEYVNFQADYQRCLLQIVEQGMRPSFLITWEDNQKLKNTNSRNLYSTRYDLLRDMLIDWYAQLAPVWEQLEGASITGHGTQGELTRVQWSNGVSVYLNYGSREAEMDGISLPGLSYKVVCAHEE